MNNQLLVPLKIEHLNYYFAKIKRKALSPKRFPFEHRLF